MAVFVGKPIDLVFHAWAIPGANTFNLAHEHRASIKARPNDVVRSFIGMRNPTRHLCRVHVCTTHETEHRNTGIGIQATGHAVARLLLAL
jgi:hypothetical protein